jgi:pimeloyl-[acyl-carrier protein] synthase
MQEFTIDLFDPAVRRDPYPYWARLRDMDRVVRSPALSPGGFLGRRSAAYVVHRFEDVRRVFADHDRFSSARLLGQGGGAEEAERGRAQLMELLMADADTRALFEDPEMQANLRASLFSGTTMLSADRPDHDRLRGVVSKAFFPRQVSSLEGQIRELTQDLVAPLADGGEHELIDTLAGPLPSIVIAEMLGIPREDHGMFKDWSNAVVGSIDTDDLGGVEDPIGRLRSRLLDPARMELIGEFRRYLGEQIDRYRVERGDNLISRMVQANEHEVLSAEELTASTFLLLIAGNETTTRLIANLTVALHRHPDQQALLAEEPGLIPAAVEEGLRYDSPVQTISRLSTADTDFGDVTIPANRVVTMAMAAANRDPDQFDDPDRFDVHRESSANVAFGYGIHFCLGAPLARRETRIAFEELLRVAPDLRVVNADDLVYKPILGAMLRGPERVVVTA